MELEIKIARKDVETMVSRTSTKCQDRLLTSQFNSGKYDGNTEMLRFGELSQHCYVIPQYLEQHLFKHKHLLNHQLNFLPTLYLWFLSLKVDRRYVQSTLITLFSTNLNFVCE